MVLYHYPSSNVSSTVALYQSALSQGMYDVEITMTGNDVCIFSDMGSQAAADMAVLIAGNGTLFSDATIKAQACKANTAVLQEGGMTWTRPSDSTIFRGIACRFDDAADIKTIMDSVIAGDVALPIPQIMDTGRGFLLVTNTDVTSLYQACLDTVDYIQGAKVNSDGSLGEAAFMGTIEQILLTQDRAALDALQDTRSI